MTPSSQSSESPGNPWAIQLGGWSVRGNKIQDGYTHLYIDHLRPYVAMLDEAVQTARKVLDAEKLAAEAVANLRPDTVATQSSGVAEHAVA
jgi:uncharacterized protein YbjQ (UPF0145 family)